MKEFLVAIFSQITMGIPALVKGAKSSCTSSNPIYSSAWTASSSANLHKHALKMSLKGPFPEVSRELQVAAPWTSASQRGLPTHVPNTASAGHGHTHRGTRGITADFIRREQCKGVFHTLPKSAWDGLRAARHCCWAKVLSCHLSSTSTSCSLFPDTLTHLGGKEEDGFECERKKTNHLH